MSRTAFVIHHNHLFFLFYFTRYFYVSMSWGSTGVQQTVINITNDQSCWLAEACEILLVLLHLPDCSMQMQSSCSETIPICYVVHAYAPTAVTNASSAYITALIANDTKHETYE